jgi:hypothetical protein
VKGVKGQIGNLENININYYVNENDFNPSPPFTPSHTTHLASNLDI